MGGAWLKAPLAEKTSGIALILHAGVREYGGVDTRGLALPRSISMAEDKKAIHINHVGENWEVEDDRATLGQTETQPEAIELAAEMAPEARANVIEVHASDGRVEKRIPVNPPADARDGSLETLSAESRPQENRE